MDNTISTLEIPEKIGYYLNLQGRAKSNIIGSTTTDLEVMGWHKELLQKHIPTKVGVKKKKFQPIVDIEDDVSFISDNELYSDPFNQAYYITQTFTQKQLKNAKKVDHMFETLVKDVLQK